MRERELFLAALDIEDPVARQAHLKTECAGDVELLARVESLLESHESQSQFLNTPVVEQISDATDAELPATTFCKSDSTRNSDPEAPTLLSDRAAAMTEHQDDPADEVALGFLDPSSRPDSLGRLGHYEVLEVIGHGAFGTVLRAFDEKLQRVVAIKVLAPEMATTSPARKRFLREARASAAIRHENVVSIYAVEEKPLPHLVMEFIPGQTLQQRLNQVGPLNVPTVLRLGRQIAEGLAAAHAQDLIHRDIKPGNILLETSVHERVKITDFGLARTADDASMTQSGTIAGTPMYMAPEQAMGHKLDQRADLFSFGSVLYQMVTGRAPFRAPTTLAVLKRLAEDTPRPIREIIPETPQWLCDIITKLHAKNPDERYQSAREIADVLADCESQLKAHSGLKDLSVIPCPKKPTATLWKRVSAAVLLLPLLMLGLYALNRPATQTETPQTPTTDSIATVTPDHAREAAVPDADGWVQLFNGNDLTGWKTHPDQHGEWEIKDGVLVGSKVGSYLFSDGSKFENFHLRIQAKINRGGDSSIFFRSPFVMRPGRYDSLRPAGGYEAELHRNRDYNVPTGSIWNAESVGIPKLLSKAADLSVTEIDDWFNLEIIARGNHFITKVNGTQTVECDDPNSSFREGHLALQVLHPQTIVQFRKIEITELPASPPPMTKGFVHLFNGKDTTGWKTHPDQGGRWDVKDGILIGSTRQSYLFSERGDYGNFHLRAEVKINQGGDSGIQFRAPFGLRQGRTPKDFAVPACYEAEMQENRSYARPTGSISEVTGNAPPSILGKAFGSSRTQPDEWFTIEVIATDNHFVTKINGIEAANCNDPLDRHQTGHLALQVWNANTMVQFRKIEIKELPPSAPTPQPQFYSSNEWIDVIPLIVPQLDKWDMRLTGKNEWRIEQGELVVGSANEKPSKLLFPLDTDFIPSFECELELTRRTGEHGFNLNFPTANGDTPLTFDFPAKRGVFVRHLRNGIMPISESSQIETEKRTTIRVEVRRQQGGDQISVWNKDAVVGTWKGDRNELASGNNEGYEHRRRLSLWIHGGHNEFVFHRIRIRMLDGGTAESLRPVPSAAPSTSPPLAIAPFDVAQARAHQEAWAKHLGVPVEYTNSIGMKFRLMPPGEFMMGSSPGEIAEAMIAAGNDDNWKTHLKSEEPQHKVVLTQPFYLGVHEVTQAEYERIAGKNPSFFAELGNGKDRVAGLQTSRFPVEQVTWSDATAFAKKLGQSELGTADAYYLPTEAEWEFACRAGTQTKYCFGDTDGFLSEHGRHGTSRTHAVGELKPNAFQLHDMHGNVWEWVNDLWDTQYYSSFANVAAQNPRGPQAPHDRHVTRGGCWANPPSSCRSAHRISEPERTWGFLLGFRLALNVDAIKASKPPAPSASVAPFTDADVRRIAALPTSEQIEEVRKELKKRNPEFDGTLTPTIENDVVTGLEFFTQHVTDISPVRAFRHLTSLNCRADGATAGMVSDLKPLKGMQLTRLTLSVNPVSDLTPLQGMPLTDLHVDNSHVADLSPLEGMPLKVLNCSNTKVASLAPLKGMPLIIVWCNNTEIADLSPVKGMSLEWITIQETKINNLSSLKGMPLTQIYLDFQPQRDTELLQAIRTLVKINDKPAAEFWKETQRK